MRGLVQQGSEQRHRSSAEAFAADEQLGQPVGADGPFLVVEVSEGQVAGFGGAVAQGEHDERDLRVSLLDGEPGGLDRGDQRAGHGAVRGLTRRCQRCGHAVPPVVGVRGGPFVGLPARGRDRRRGVPHVQEPPAGWTAQRRAASLMWGCGGGTGSPVAAVQVIQARRTSLRQGPVAPRLVVGAISERAAGAPWLVPP